MWNPHVLKHLDSFEVFCYLHIFLLLVLEAHEKTIIVKIVISVHGLHTDSALGTVHQILKENILPVWRNWIDFP